MKFSEYCNESKKDIIISADAIIDGWKDDIYEFCSGLEYELTQRLGGVQVGPASLHQYERIGMDAANKEIAKRMNKIVSDYVKTHKFK